MLPPPTLRFLHTINKNGIVDSICAECRVRIASSRDEAGLARNELGHVCNPIRLYQLMEDGIRARLEL